MLLSIIIPCYNTGGAMGPLLEAIAAQLDVDCELILVNDGSSDQTAAHLEAYAAAYDGAARIVLLTTPNGGAAAARAHGLGLASGDFVYFCDSDDLFQPGFVDALRRGLAAHAELDVLYFSSDMVLDASEGLRRLAWKVRYDEKRVFRDGRDLLAHNLEHGIYTAAVWTYVARRALIERSGAVFTPRKAHEDHLYTLRIILGARLILAIPDLLYRQKIRAGSLTQSRKSSAYLVDRIEAYSEADALLRQAEFRQLSLYRKWSLGGMLSIIRENRVIFLPLLLQPAGAVLLGLGLSILGQRLLMR